MGIQNLTEEDFLSLIRLVEDEAKNRYGSLTQALSAADENLLTGNSSEYIFGQLRAVEQRRGSVTPRRKQRPEKYSDEQIMSMLVSLANKNGGFVRRSDYKNMEGAPAYSTVINKYGSFLAACQKAGVIYKTDHPGKPRFDRAEFLQKLREKIESLGRVPTTKEYDADKPSPMSAAAYLNGISWPEAVRMAGYDYHASKKEKKPVPLKDGQ